MGTCLPAATLPHPRPAVDIHAIVMDGVRVGPGTHHRHPPWFERGEWVASWGTRGRVHHTHTLTQGCSW